jgi:catechol 2,3-dioxygenase
MQQAEVPVSRVRMKAYTPRRLAHVNLWVENIERSERFYRDNCGLQVEFTEPDILATFMGVGHTQHDIGMMKTTDGVDRLGRDGAVQVPGTVGKTPGLNHIAWELQSEAALIAAYRNMTSRGVKHDAAMDHQIAHSIYLFDPDGNYNEMYSDTTADWRSVLSGEMGLITSKWDPESAAGSSDALHPVNTIARIHAEAAMHPRRITHLVLKTPQLGPMVSFYSDIIGLEVQGSDDRAVFLKGSLNEYPIGLVLLAGNESQFLHASFELESEAALGNALSELKRRGVEPLREVEYPWKRSVFLQDPDGMGSEWYVARDVARDLRLVSDADLAHAV